MPTISQARQAARSRLANGGIIDSGSVAVPLHWQNEAATLPDEPAPFIYCEFITDPGRIAAYGGGRGANLYRTPAQLSAYVFVPRDEGLDEAELIAEQVAALFRSYRDTVISCYDATVHPGGDGASMKPPGLASEVGNYFWALAEVSVSFDQVG